MAPEAYRRIQETRHLWEDRGNYLHNALQQHLEGAAELAHGEYGEWLGPLIDDFPLWDRYPAIATEFRLVDKRARFAGSLDFLLKGKNPEGKDICLLGDLKTKSANGRVGDHRAQLGAYAVMLSAHFPTLWIDRCVVVNSFPGRVELSTYEVDECVSAWEDVYQSFQSWKPEF